MGRRQAETPRQRERRAALDRRESERLTLERLDVPKSFLRNPLAADDDPDAVPYIDRLD